MRRVQVRVFVSAIAIALALGPACDTTQPTSGGDKDFGLTMEAFQAAPVFDVWDLPANLGENGVWCEAVLSNGQPLTADSNIPFPFSLQVDVIRNGSTVTETVYASATDTSPRPNMTPYQDPLGAAPAVEKTVDFGGTTITVTNGRRVTQGSRDLLDASFAFGPGACLVGASFGDPKVGGQPAPFVIRLAAGDTVRVQSRKLDELLVLEGSPRLVATPTLNGALVTPSGETTAEPGTEGISFYVTQR